MRGKKLVKPNELLEALRQALISGEITVRPRWSAYPADDTKLIEHDDGFTLKWTGAEITFHS